MPPIIQILGLPFLACFLMSLILGYLGTHVLKREVIFIDIALAQMAAVGSIAAHTIFKAHGDSALVYVCSFGCVLLAAGFYAFVRSRINQISIEAIIGISYAIAAATALFLLGIAPGGHQHIQHILSGSLLWMRWEQIIVSLAVFSVIGFCFYLTRKPIASISNSYQKGTAKSLSTVFWDFAFYVLLGVVITLSVEMAGIVVVFAFLIVPATISAIFRLHLHLQMIVIWIVAILASFIGLLFAYYFDFSVGPAVVLALGVELVVVSLCRQPMARLLKCPQ